MCCHSSLPGCLLWFADVSAFIGATAANAAGRGSTNRKSDSAPPSARLHWKNYNQIFAPMGSYGCGMTVQLRTFLADLFRTAVAAAHPAPSSIAACPTRRRHPDTRVAPPDLP